MVELYYHHRLFRKSSSASSDSWSSSALLLSDKSASRSRRIWLAVELVNFATALHQLFVSVAYPSLSAASAASSKDNGKRPSSFVLTFNRRSERIRSLTTFKANVSSELRLARAIASLNSGSSCVIRCKLL